MAARRFSRSNRISRQMSSNVRKSSYVFEYRITFLGAEKVGKSAIIHQFIEKEFLRHYQPTSEDHLTHVVEHRGNMCVCLLVDTAGSDDFPAMRKLSVTKGNAFIVVYSIDDQKSFERAKKFADEIKETKENSAEVKIVLVGNKMDQMKHREVSYTEGESFASSLQEKNVVTDFVESSAKDYESVTEIVRKLLNMFIPPPPSIEVPVLNDRKLSLPKLKLRSSSRRSSKGLIERKTSVDKRLKNESFSDSEIRISTPISPTSTRIIQKAFRNRADSSPAIQLPKFLDDSISGTPASPGNITPNEKLKRKVSPFQNGRQVIGDPILISHSVSMQRYTFQKPRSASMNSNSSNDSGVSDDSNSPELPPKFPLGRRGSLPITTASINSAFPTHNGRRASFSVKMRGIFKKSKPLPLYSDV